MVEQEQKKEIYICLMQNSQTRDLFNFKSLECTCTVSPMAVSGLLKDLLAEAVGYVTLGWLMIDLMKRL